MSKLGRDTVLYDKIYGCLVGGALGDAIGGATEMMTPEKIEAQFGWVNRPLPTGDTPETARFSPGVPAGAFTDDTRLKHLLAGAIVRKGGRITADELAAYWMEEMEGWYYTPVLNAYAKIFHGDARPRDAGRGSMASNSTAMSIAPVGIINACNPAQAAQDAYDIASIIHEGDARDAAVTVAVAVAEAFRPGTDVEQIVQAALAHVYQKGVVKDRIEAAVAVAEETMDYHEFREAFYDSMLVPTPQNVGPAQNQPPEGFYDTAEPREAVPAMFGLLVLAEGRWRMAVEYCANFGRDSDTLATMAGSIAGAYEGGKVIPQEWIEIIPGANPNAPDQHELAQGLGDALLASMERQQAQIDTVRSLAAAV